MPARKKSLVKEIEKEAPVLKTVTKSKSLQEKIKKPSFFIPAIVIILIVLLFLFRGQFVTAMVNGQPIFRYQYIKALEQQDGKTVLDGLVVNKLIGQEAAKKGVTISDPELRQDSKQIEDSIAKQGQSLDVLLAARGMTKSDFENQLKTQKLIEKMLGSQITVSDKDISDYMDQNKDSLPQGLSDNDLKNQIKQQIFQQKLGQKAQAWIQDLQQKARITYF